MCSSTGLMFVYANEQRIRSKRSWFKSLQTLKCFTVLMVEYDTLPSFFFPLTINNLFKKHLLLIPNFCLVQLHGKCGHVSVYSSCLMLHIILLIFWMACANYLAQKLILWSCKAAKEGWQLFRMAMSIFLWKTKCGRNFFF